MLFFNLHNPQMNPERQQFVERLIEVAELLDYPAHGRQTAIANRYKLKQPSVRKWFMGESMPSYEIAIDLCKRSQVSYEWLMTGRGSKFLQPVETLDPQVLAAAKMIQNMSPYQRSQTVKIIDAIAEPAPPERNGTDK